MLDKILKNKLYLSLAIAGIAVIIAAVVITCVLTCGGSGNKADNDADGNPAASEQPIFEFEVVMDEDDEIYPVTYISASDFHATIESDSDYTDRLILEDIFADTNAKAHYLLYVNVSGTDYVSASSGVYLELDSNVYDINYTNCDSFKYDIDNDGKEELIFYTCETFEDGSRSICTYYVIGDEKDDIHWCRYNRAWAVGTDYEITSSSDAGTVEVAVPAEDSFLVSLMIQGVDHEVYGRLVCDNSGEEPFYYIDAGEYTDLLERMDGLDKE